MLARFQAAGGSVVWKDYTDTKCTGVFTHPQAGSVTVEWDIARAKRIGLTGKDSWKNYSRAMLRARCISEGVRTCFPGIAVGIYTPEEIEAGDAEIDITPSKSDTAMQGAVEASATALTLDEIEEHVNAMNNAVDLKGLQDSYMAGHEHAKQAKDNAARARFKAVYDLRSAALAPKNESGSVI
jgi:hypothetical protein